MTGTVAAEYEESGEGGRIWGLVDRERIEEITFARGSRIRCGAPTPSTT
ncbi:hypothetical protein ACFO4E_29125 [Nocardiopsis mangrovi]|uniref:Uncharacterized protein n=1 Tax=Nocardiopsis mangrovi TaxID=1179818 RepID=A0ABV9E410_9ACTN